MSYFMQHGDAFVPTAGKDSILDALPVGNYVVALNPMTGMFFHRTQRFTRPEKMYGDFDERADRVLKTFMDRERATGVLFAGEKGSGKTQLARLISIKAYDLGIPTLLVNAPYTGDQFNNLLADVEGPAIVFMDEFEKVYDSQSQESVLTLLDGAMTTQKLFILTVNNKWKIDSNMRNRPGRLFYLLDFDGLESNFVREYCEDNLDDKSQVEAVVRISTMFEKFNFDILKALVEEMNRYQEAPFDALKMLNAKPVDHESYGTRYEVKVWNPAGVEGELDIGENSETENHPLNIRGGVMHFYATFGNEDDGENDGCTIIQVRGGDVQKLNAEKGEFEFVNDDGYRFTFLKKKPKPYSYETLMEVL